MPPHVSSPQKLWISSGNTTLTALDSLYISRVRMVLRCRYFLRLWRRFLQAGKYPEGKYYISREANDMLGRLVDGLLGLVYVYHD